MLMHRMQVTKILTAVLAVTTLAPIVLSAQLGGTGPVFHTNLELAF
jgi:hypothetical protein